MLEQRRWDAAAQVRRAQAERASRRGAMPRRQPQGYTVWEAMQGVTLLERDELVRERGRVRVQVEEDAALARAIHISQLDAVWPPGPETDLAGALPRPLTPLERHTAMADSGSRANSASELGLPATPVTGRGDAIALPLAFASSVSSPPSPLPSPSPPWSLTHAAWNALMHALWGNTPTPQPEAPAAPARRRPRRPGRRLCGGELAAEPWLRSQAWVRLVGGRGRLRGCAGAVSPLCQDRGLAREGPKAASQALAC